ncbi:MAG: U32 family peptidase [Clostridia bacterium]|nr:U32 family peptidase [Clostridia bacterium]
MKNTEIEKIEVLSPAGSPESLKAAVFAGADAVYLGGSLFGARASAVNFNNEDLAEAVKFCHVRNVKVYVTVNTIIKDSELDDALKFIRFLASIGVDAVLLQDLGLIRLIKERCPELPIHASTQMSISTKYGTKLLADYGFSRVVVSRELSLKEISEIHNAVPVELEAFVHGALCMCVSGQCYFSAMLGSRSGNRGRCAQPCRLPFTSDDGFEYALSLKDSSFITQIDNLRKAGVYSAKIEGRMKRPEYVAAATSACRKTADGEPVSDELLNNLEAVFSRSGFTDAYLSGNRNRDMFGIRTKEDVLNGSSAVFNQLHELYKGEAGRVPVKMEFSLYNNCLPYLSVADEDGNFADATGEVEAELAVNKPLDAERIESQLKKLGGTPYHLKSAVINTDEVSRIPMSAINEMRRKCIDKLTELRSETKPYGFTDIDRLSGRYTSHSRSLRAVFANMEQVPDDLSSLELVYFPLTESIENFRKLSENVVKVGVNMPRMFMGADEEVAEKVRILIENGFDTFLCGTLDAAAVVKVNGGKVHAGFSMNVINTESLVTCKELGFDEVELSFESELADIAKLGGDIPRGIMAYGYQPLMLNRACPIGHGSCAGCKETAYLTDRKGYRFPVVCMKGKKYRSVEILNSTALNLSDRQNEINNVDFMILRFTIEDKDTVSNVINSFVSRTKPEGEYTRGLYYRGII